MSYCNSEPCFLMELPTELRLHVYDYLLADANRITITAAPLTVFGRTIADRSRKTPIPGLPATHCPLVRSHYDPALLSISNPPTIELEKQANWDTNHDELPYQAPLALLQSCKMIHEELSDYMRRKRMDKNAKGGLSLYVTYPYGVLALKELYPFLLRQAKNIYISGYYASPEPEPAEEIASPRRNPLDPGDQSQRHRVLLDLLELPAPICDHLPPYTPELATIGQTALASLVRTVLPDVPIPVFQKLEARIYYPIETSYATVWSDDNGPIVQVLKNTYGGLIDMDVSRGAHGNGVLLTAKPSPRSRCVSTVWNSLSNRRKESEAFVIGDEWPEEG